MNTLDVAIRAVLIPFRSLSRCLAENYKMYFGYSTVFSVQYLSGGVKWIWATHRCYILISFRGVFWKFRRAPPNFYRDEAPAPGASQSLSFIFIWQNWPYICKTTNYKLIVTSRRLREYRGEIKRNNKIYLYPYICLQKVRYSSLVCSCSLWDVFNSKTQPRLSLIFFLSSAFNLPFALSQMKYLFFLQHLVRFKSFLKISPHLSSHTVLFIQYSSDSTEKDPLKDSPLLHKYSFFLNW